MILENCISIQLVFFFASKIINNLLHQMFFEKNVYNFLNRVYVQLFDRVGLQCTYTVQFA